MLLHFDDFPHAEIQSCHCDRFIRGGRFFCVFFLIARSLFLQEDFLFYMINLTNQSIGRSNNQTIDQSINQSINQANDKVNPVPLLLFLPFCLFLCPAKPQNSIAKSKRDKKAKKSQNKRTPWGSLAAALSVSFSDFCFLPAPPSLPSAGVSAFTGVAAYKKDTTILIKTTWLIFEFRKIQNTIARLIAWLIWFGSQHTQSINQLMKQANCHSKAEHPTGATFSAGAVGLFSAAGTVFPVWDVK